MSIARKVFAVPVLAALAWAAAPVADAQVPIRIGATLALTGGIVAADLNTLHGYQLCVKHLNDKGGVLGRLKDVIARLGWPGDARRRSPTRDSNAPPASPGTSFARRG